MTNNPYSDGDIYFGIDAGMANTRYVNPKYQQIDKTLTGMALVTATNLTVFEGDTSTFVSTHSSNGGGATLKGRDTIFDGVIFSDPSQTSGVAETESLPSDTTINFGSANLDVKFVDNFDQWNSSVDTAKWTTTGTVSETGALLRVSGNTGTSTAEINGSGSQNLQSKRYIVFICQSNGVMSAGNASGSVSFQLNDGSSDTTFYSQTTGMNNQDSSEAITSKFIIEVFNDVTNQRAVIYVNGRFIDQYNYATATLRAKFTATSSGVSSQSRFDVYLVGTGKASPTSTVAYTVTADGGSNYESYTENDVHTFSNTGNDLRLKSTFTLSASETMVAKSYTLQVDR